MARSKKATVALVPPAPPSTTFAVDPLLVTGVCDRSEEPGGADVLSNVLDELNAVLAALEALNGGEPIMGNLISMAKRKALAATELHDMHPAWAGKERA